MKTIVIALKDLRRMFMSAFFLAFGLVLPLATAALFYFAFGGMASSDGGFDLAPIPVVIANLDHAQGGLAAGDVVAGVLEDSLPDLIRASRAEDAAAARSAVDRQQAAVAVIIPEGLSAAVIQPDGRATVELYSDPTLTLGPGIVQGIVHQVVDAFAGTKIATGVAAAQLAGHGATVNPATLQDLAMEYATWSARAAGQGEGETRSLLDVRPPAGTSDEGAGALASMLGQIMAGMMVFYVFFSGAAASDSILEEDENGTLARLFTTPTSQSAILGGKFLSTFLLLTVQVAVLLVASSLLFGIDWGPPALAAAVGVGLVAVATGFGLLVTSLLLEQAAGGHHLRRGADRHGHDRPGRRLYRQRAGCGQPHVHRLAHRAPGLGGARLATAAVGRRRLRRLFGGGRHAGRRAPLFRPGRHALSEALCLMARRNPFEQRI